MSIEIRWWSASPYVTSRDNTTSTECLSRLTGLFYSALEQSLETCLTPDSKSEQVKCVHVSNQAELEDYDEANRTVMMVPYSTMEGDAASHFQWHSHEWTGMGDTDMGSHHLFVPLVTSPGAIHFYRQEDQPVGSDLLTVILQGWPMLILILLGASYSGIIIWLLDRLWNPSNFPKPFRRGFWEGFWWAFVTMTTVGYGDTTPRSIQARIYGLIWIVIGITILSVFTATVTTVLTQQSMGQHVALQGSQVAVLNGTQEFKLALMKGANPLVCDNISDLRTKLQWEGTKAALLDQYMFASRHSGLPSNILVEDIMGHLVHHGVMLTGPDESLISCLSHSLRESSKTIYAKLPHWIHPITHKTTTAAEQAQTLFQPTTITYMWYGAAAWFVIYCGFVFWELCYWLPKHERKKAKKMRTAGPAFLDQSTMTLRSDWCPDNDVIRPHILSASHLTASTLSQNTLMHNYPVSQCYVNEAFDPLDMSVTSYTSHTDTVSFETLVDRQRRECHRLKREFDKYRHKWQKNLTDLKRIHRHERAELTKVMQNQMGKKLNRDSSSQSENASDNGNVFHTWVNDLSKPVDEKPDSSYQQLYDENTLSVYEV